MLEKNVVIKNKLGLHARASAKLVNEARRYASEILLLKENKKANAKSIMGVMMLAATQGTPLVLQVSGYDAELALQQIETLINNRFGEAE